MDIEMPRYLANDIQMHPTLLKEVSPPQKKELHLLADKISTLIIDYGSETIKAAYDFSSNPPDLVFRPQISKNKDPNRNQLPPKHSINVSYEQLDMSKINYKSPYERNLILHFGLLEQCNDYIFSELGRPGKKIRSPMIISEPFANPGHCRGSLLEQLFECYEVESVMIGVDALFGYFYEVDCNLNRYEEETTLLVSMGATTIHVLAILNGKPDFNSLRRINLGANNAFQIFSKSLLLKNPQLKTKLTYALLRDFFEKFTSVAINYNQQLRYFQSKFKYSNHTPIYRNKIQQQNKLVQEKIQFREGIEIDFDTIIEIPEEEIQRKQEVRKRMAEKLKETLNRRKEMKKRMHQIQLKNYLELKEKYEAHDKFAHEEVVEMFGDHHPHEKLEKKIKALQIKLGLAQEKPDEAKFSLINIPDNQLPPEKLKYKKLQIYQKQAVERRRQKQQEKEQEEQVMKELRENNPELYLHQLKQKYQVVFTKAKQSERIKNQLNNRKSKLKQRKMQAMARLVEDEEDQNFGENQDDWLAYKDPQESDHYSELDAMEAELRQIDPEWTQAKDHHHLKETNQLFLLGDLIKCHEIYFQPQLIGVNQMGIIETIRSSLSLYPVGVSSQLLKNILVIGGGSIVSGLKERFEKDLRQECPAGSQINVKIGKGGWKGAILGMQSIGKNQREFLHQMSFRREDYLNKTQSQQSVKHPWSNPLPK